MKTHDEAVGRGHEHHERERDLGDIGVEPEAHDEGEHGGDEEAPPRERGVGDRTPEHHRRPWDRQRAEPVVHAGGGVLGDTRSCRHPEPQDPGREEAGHEEVDVVDPATGVDRAAEDVAEHEQEQRTLHRPQHEQLRRAEELQDRSLRALERGGDEAGTGRARSVVGPAATSVRGSSDSRHESSKIRRRPPTRPGGRCRDRWVRAARP